MAVKLMEGSNNDLQVSLGLRFTKAHLCQTVVAQVFPCVLCEEENMDGNYIETCHLS